MKKIVTIIILVTFLFSFASSGYAYTQILEFLCELGLKYYRQGRLEDALLEFKKALLIQPNYAPALKYIQMLEQVRRPKEIKEEITPRIPPSFQPTKPAIQEAIEEYLDLIEIQQEMIKYKQSLLPIIPKEKILPTKVILLDETLAKIIQPIEIELDKSYSIVGKNIERFLVTEPNILAVEKKGANELFVTGKDIGYTYLHIWDDSGRNTLEFLGVFPVPEGPTYEELLRREEERAQNFKLRYSLDWSSYETGRRIYNLERSGHYPWTHTIGLDGETPYGRVDTAATVRRLKTTTDLTYAGFGLYNGNIGPFKGFTLRGGDYSPYFSNLAFPSTTVRGAMLASPAFNKKIEYNAFWGRESGGRFPRLHPELYKSKHSFLNGVNVSYTPVEKQNYQFSLLHGWGRHRENYLNPYAYDLLGSWILNKWRLGSEVAYDSETLAKLLNANYRGPQINFFTEIRDIDKDYLSITGTGWRQGQLGTLLNLDYKPNKKLDIYNKLDIYRDRLYPAQDDNDRWNQDYNLNLSYQVEPETGFSLNFTIQNDLGKLSQLRYQTAGVGLTKKFKFIRDITTNIGYARQENKNFSSPSADYINDKITLGLRFKLVSDLYYYLSKEINWLEARYFGERSMPNVSETGLDWSSQWGKSPLRSTFRFTYRDEEDTTSALSFLSGEDYIEGYTELTYNEAEREIYGSCRVRNSWADNPNVTKRIEASFNAGMRYVWNTGLRWDAVCNVETFVFKDFNSDGLRERDEPPVEGVKIWLGKDKFQVTDVFGYCKFKGVRGKKAYLNIDMSTVPSGYLLTVPASQEINIVHNQTIGVNFGIMTRSEISGYVFDDGNGNGKFDQDEKGIEGIVLNLEDGKTTRTDITGRYIFAQVSPGEHTITLDLNSIPVYYLPQTALFKKITLFEGVTYVYNIPLRRIKE